MSQATLTRWISKVAAQNAVSINMATILLPSDA